MGYEYHGCIKRKGNLLYCWHFHESMNRYPPALKYFCEAILFNDDDYMDYKDALVYLDSVGAHYLEYDRADAALKYLSWVESFFSNHMFPLDYYGYVWEENLTSILYILKRSSFFLNDRLMRDAIGKKKYLDAREYRRLLQNINVYYLVAYNYSSNIKGFNEVLELVSYETLLRVKELLASKDPVSLWDAKITVREGVIISAHEYWQEPFSWIIHEAEGGDFSSSIIEGYERYLKELYSLQKTYNTDVMKEIIDSTEGNLRNLCVHCITKCEYDIEELEESLELRSAERREYESLIKESEERVYQSLLSMTDVVATQEENVNE